MATNKINVDEGADVGVATHTITEDAVTKHLQRVVLNESDGTSVGVASETTLLGIKNSLTGGIPILESVGGDPVVWTVPGIATEDLSNPVAITSDQMGLDGAISGPYSVTSATDVHIWDMKGYAALDVQITSAGTSNQMIFETSNDGTNWTTAGAYEVGGDGNPTNVGFTATANRIYDVPRRGRYTKLRVTSYNSGTVTVIASYKTTQAYMMGSSAVRGTQQSGQGLSSTNLFGLAAYSLTANPSALGNGQAARVMATSLGQIVVRPYSLPEETWFYAAATGGIENTTTAVTIKAAAAAGIRNYLTGLEISTEALTNATILAVRDGAGGTVLWRGRIGTSGLPLVPVKFDPPLRGSPATLMEVVTLTASGAGKVYVNARGFQAP